MSADGFLAPRRSSAISMGAVVALHVVVLGAVILAKGPHVFSPPPVFRLIPIAPEAPPPPPVPPAPPTARDTQPAPQSTAPHPAIAPLQPDLTKIALAPLRDVTPPVPVADLPPVKTPPAPLLTDATVDPRYADALQPPYPPALARAEVEGKVVVRVLVGTDGRVKDVQAVSADDPGFFAATAAQARRYWRFKPATRDGVAVESWRTMTVRFALQA